MSNYNNGIDLIELQAQMMTNGTAKEYICVKDRQLQNMMRKERSKLS